MIFTVWTARLAVAFYLGRAFLDLTSRNLRGSRSRYGHARLFWTAGCTLNLLHVFCAFALVHSWSHELAYRHTADRTAALTGIAWGGGLYLNYAFSAFWLADVAVWWARGVEFPYRAPQYLRTLHVVFAFMMFNATAVFGPPIWRPVAVVVAAAFVVTYYLTLSDS